MRVSESKRDSIKTNNRKKSTKQTSITPFTHLVHVRKHLSCVVLVTAQPYSSVCAFCVHFTHLTHTSEHHRIGTLSFHIPTYAYHYYLIVVFFVYTLLCSFIALLSWIYVFLAWKNNIKHRKLIRKTTNNKTKQPKTIGPHQLKSTTATKPYENKYTIRNVRITLGTIVFVICI